MNYEEFMKTYAGDRRIIEVEVLPEEMAIGEGPSVTRKKLTPWVIVRCDDIVAVIDIIEFTSAAWEKPQDRYLDLDVHSFVGGEKAQSSAMQMTNGASRFHDPNDLTVVFVGRKK